MRVLIVRLGSLGDIIHALPVASALREAFPDAQLDWVVDERNRDLLDLVPILDGRIVFRSQSAPRWRAVGEVVAALRRGRYDVALDLQGLLKSAVLARASGARRIIGFPTPYLREWTARPFYTETADPRGTRHVIDTNLSLAARLGVTGVPARFPLDASRSNAPAAVRTRLGLDEAGQFALLNPGGGWPNKRWPPERFGAVAASLHRRGLPSAVLWGPGEEALGREVVRASGGATELAPATSIADVVALARAATLMVSGDTGPLHIAAAVGTPIVGIYGPTDPARNGPWAARDVTVARFARCRCHHRRRCRAAVWCLGEIAVEEVTAAVDERLGRLAQDG